MQAPGQSASSAAATAPPLTGLDLLLRLQQQNQQATASGPQQQQQPQQPQQQQSQLLQPQPLAQGQYPGQAPFALPASASAGLRYHNAQVRSPAGGLNFRYPDSGQGLGLSLTLGLGSHHSHVPRMTHMMPSCCCLPHGELQAPPLHACGRVRLQYSDAARPRGRAPMGPSAASDKHVRRTPEPSQLTQRTSPSSLVQGQELLQQLRLGQKLPTHLAERPGGPSAPAAPPGAPPYSYGYAGQPQGQQDALKALLAQRGAQVQLVWLATVFVACAWPLHQACLSREQAAAMPASPRGGRTP